MVRFIIAERGVLATVACHSTLIIVLVNKAHREPPSSSESRGVHCIEARAPTKLPAPAREWRMAPNNLVLDVGVPPVDGLAAREHVAGTRDVGGGAVDGIHPPAHAAVLFLGEAGDRAYVHAVAGGLGIERDTAARQGVVDGRARGKRERGRGAARAGGRAVDGDAHRDGRALLGRSTRSRAVSRAVRRVAL